MKYTLESNWTFPRRDDGWEPSKAWRQFSDVEKAVKAIKHDADSSLVVSDLRVVDENGVVYAVYEVEKDMRLPECRWEATQRDAYFLWQAAGCPTCDGTEFWHLAEEKIDKDAIGVTIYELQPSCRPVNSFPHTSTSPKSAG